ncbi:hypothetical protein D2E25_0600 [Bifidobacterium goeldii]|uniref:Uncharacterized protein n=1 Tax=Bifidobacterium goeldii TaxID=2306975 RepID=A0A430FN81_9BIFI|nr:hypothetical protein [Bifidobacterium goeldii]RSX54292.1 hypothetical protein D2E25_0600 [Bifidobacterium goeldii]
MSEYTDTLDLNKLKEPAYVWIGKELPQFLRDEDDSAIPMIVAINRLHDFPPDFNDVIQYMATPREESVLLEWLKGQQAPDDFLPWMIQEKAILRIDPGMHILDSFEGVHLEPYGFRVPVEGQEQQENPKLSNVIYSSNPNKKTRELSPTLIDLLFSQPRLDVRASIRRTADHLNRDSLAVAHEVIKTIADLCANDFAFLMWME